MFERGQFVVFPLRTEFCYIDPRYDGPSRSPRDGESMAIRAGTVGVFAGYLRWVEGLSVLTATDSESDWCSVRLGRNKHYAVDLPLQHVRAAAWWARPTPLPQCLETTPEWFRYDP